MPVFTSSATVSKPASATENRRLKIGISIASFTPNTGGLQAHAQNLCKHLQLRGHEVWVVTRSATHVPVYDDYLFFNEPDDDIRVNGIRVRPLRLSHKWSPVLWTILKTAARPGLRPVAARLYEMAAARPAREAFSGFDLIHHIGEAVPLNGFAAAAAAKYWQIPFVAQPTCHPHHVGDSALDLNLFAKADRLLVHTQYEADYFRQLSFQCPIDVVGNGIEDRADGDGGRFRKRFGISGPFILFIGRKDPQKGCPLLLEAFKTVRHHRPDISLVCMGPAGSGNKDVKAEGLIDLEFVSEEMKHDALAACTCLCVPSEGESFGLVFMEAGRYGKPVAGRNVAVLRELLNGGQAGLLLGLPDEKTNSATLGPEELASALLSLLSDPDECSRIGENCRLISDQYIWPRIVERFEASYYETLNHTLQKT